MVKCLPTMWETQVQSRGWDDPLEKEMATHSSTLAWKIPWTEEPGRLQFMGSQRVGHEWSSGFSYFLQFKSEFGNKEFMIWATVSSGLVFFWLYRASPLGFLLCGNFSSFTTPSPGQVSVPNSFVSFCLLYFVLPPFEENGLPFWVPGVLRQCSELVLWKFLSIQMIFWWICGEKVVSPSYSFTILSCPNLSPVN